MAVQRGVAKGSIGTIVQIRNVFTCDMVESIANDYTQLWTYYLTDVLDPICQCLAGVILYTDFEFYVPSGDDWILTGAGPLASGGQEGGDYLPNAVAIVLEGIAAGSRHIGRKFFSGVAEGFTSGNVLTGAAVGYAATALYHYVTPYSPFGGGSYTPGTYDKNHVFHPFVSGIVASLLGSQRRRKPGVGI